MSATNTASIEYRTRINNFLEKLRNKFKSFAVIDLQGKILGRVKDFLIDKNRQLNLVVIPPEAPADSSLFLLNTKSIQKVDAANRSLFVDRADTEFPSLPNYNSDLAQFTENSGSSSKPSVEPASTSGLAGTPEQEASQNSSPQPLEEAQELQQTDGENISDSDQMSEVVEEEIVRLLEERLVVNRSKRKVGEVVVRKEVETVMVQVPVQREKLVVEQVGSESKKLAEIDLGQGEVTGVGLADIPSSDTPYTVRGEFLSPKAVSNLLDAIALQKPHGCTKVRVELVVENPEFQANYQKMFDRCSIR